MTDTRPIHDLHIAPLMVERLPHARRMVGLRDDDHLLRRFGQAEIISLRPGEVLELKVREVADEVWALFEGRVEFVWEDLRQGSPTLGCGHRMTTGQPTRVLVPFGVRFTVLALDGPATLLRIATHADSARSGDHTLDQEGRE